MDYDIDFLSDTLMNKFTIGYLYIDTQLDERMIDPWKKHLKSIPIS